MFSIQSWVDYTKDHPKLVKKSECVESAGRVLQFRHNVDKVTAFVQASMKDKSYKVEVSCFHTVPIKASQNLLL